MIKKISTVEQLKEVFHMLYSANIFDDCEWSWNAMEDYLPINEKARNVIDRLAREAEEAISHISIDSRDNDYMTTVAEWDDKGFDVLDHIELPLYMSMSVLVAGRAGNTSVQLEFVPEEKVVDGNTADVKKLTEMFQWKL